MPKTGKQMLDDALNPKKPIKKTGKFQGKSNKLGGGGRFKQMIAKGKSPALAATIGRKKYGAKKMAAISHKKGMKNKK